MITITFNPSGEATADLLTPEQLRDIEVNEPRIKFVKDENGILTFHVMSNGDLGDHDVWSGIDEYGRLREVVVPVADGFHVFLIVLQRRAGIFQDDPNFFVRIFLMNVCTLEQDLGAQKSELAEVVHFKKFRVVDVVVTVDGTDEFAERFFLRYIFNDSVEPYPMFLKLNVLGDK